MTKSSRLIAFETLYNIFYDGSYSNIALDKALSGVSDDKAFICALVYGVTERKITLDYFIDMNEIQLNNETSYGSTTISVIDKTITAGYVSRGTQKIEIDPKIADFNNNKEIIFLDFFKYDFGNAIKGLNLKN